MKRTPLTRSTGLAPGKPLRRVQMAPRTKRINPRSARMASIYEQRRPLVADLLRRFPTCQVQWDEGCRIRSVDVHEILTRARGGSILDEANCLTTCRWCHEMIGAHPAEALERGFIRSSWSLTPQV